MRVLIPELTRERLSAETGLVVVGGADSTLRLSRRKKRADHLTQAMVDRAVVAEVRDFLVATLTNQLRQLPPQLGAGGSCSASSLAAAGPTAAAGGGGTFAVPSHDSFVSIAGIPRNVRGGRKRNSSSASIEGVTGTLHRW